MKIETNIIHHRIKKGKLKGVHLYYEIQCPFCKNHYLNVFSHFVRSKCGIKFVELVLKGKKREIAGRKEALLNGWKE